MNLTLPIIVLDRDGVINQDSPYYIKSVDEFIFLPNSVEAIAKLTQAGYQIAVATNQSGIARGYYDIATLTAIHGKLRSQVEAAGGRIDEIVYCPHAPDEGCACRKPKPGLLLDLSKRFNRKTSDFIFVGDKISDIEAARAVGATPILVKSDMTDKLALQTYSPILVFDSLADYVLHLLKVDHES